MPLADSDIKDLVTGTLKHLGKLKFNQIATRLQNYEVMGRILKKDKVQFEDGIGIQRTIMVDHSGAAKHTGLYEPDVVNVADVLKTIEVPWRHTTANYAFERREMLMNRGESRIVNLLKVRRADAMISLAELMETDFWTLPGDALSPYGIPYWVVKDATVGFNGGASTYGDPGGLAPATYTRWKNYSGAYLACSKDDLIEKMKTAHRYCQWKPPVEIPDFKRGDDQYRLYMNGTTIAGMERLAEDQNDRLGTDLASMFGVTTFRRHPLVWVPKLDSDTQNPVYMLNFAWIYPVFLKGDYLRETEAEKSPHQHNTFVTHIDLTWNILCTDRRSQAVFHIA